jgi:2-dehydropantoate 2-reductase
MTNRTYTIIGTGAVGGFYGAKLQKAGHQVRFLLRSDYQHVFHKGLIVESVDGDIILPQVEAYDDVQKIPPSDVIIIALKATQNHLLKTLLPPSLITENNTILLLQNGINIEPTIAPLLKKNTLIGGLCFLCANKVGPGHIRHIDYSAIAIGEYSQDYASVGITEKMQAIQADFAPAGIDIQLSEDLLLARWKKLVWNIPYNGLSVVLDARTDEIMANNDALFAVKQLMTEVQLGAKAWGRIIGDDFLEKRRDDTVKMNPYLTSMKLDFDGKRPLELEAIFANTLQMVKARGIDLPMISLLYHQLKFLDERNRRT